MKRSARVGNSVVEVVTAEGSGGSLMVTDNVVIPKMPRVFSWWRQRVEVDLGPMLVCGCCK